MSAFDGRLFLTTVSVRFSLDLSKAETPLTDGRSMVVGVVERGGVEGWRGVVVGVVAAWWVRLVVVVARGGRWKWDESGSGGGCAMCAKAAPFYAGSVTVTPWKPSGRDVSFAVPYDGSPPTSFRVVPGPPSVGKKRSVVITVKHKTKH